MQIVREERKPVTYRDAGVDIDTATGALAAISKHAQSTFGATGASPIGHFGGMYRLPSGPDQILVASADGIGTKLKLAFIVGGEAHFRVGADLVNHCANDILACGARGLFFLDYVSMGKLDPFALERLVAGMAHACRENGLALIGGETAEMPGMYTDGEYDAAGFIVGTVSPDRVVDGSKIEIGDALVGLPSVGLHTNGYSLARRIVGLTDDRATDTALLAQELPGDSVPIGSALLREHPSYIPSVMPLVERGLIRGIAHITGGGLIDNVPRMLPETVAAKFDTSTWTAPPIFSYLVERGQVPIEDQFRALNMGIGMVLAIASSDADQVVASIGGARVIGEIVSRNDGPAVLGLDTTPATAPVDA
ncbi:MAG: phosphoribosylformylglycinamidine cyclo-ligase [Thermomicrobiales bacterium]